MMSPPSVPSRGFDFILRISVDCRTFIPNVDRLTTPAAGALSYDGAWYTFVIRSRWETGGSGAAGGAEPLGVGVVTRATGRVRSADPRISTTATVQAAAT